jgi:hypothetical protein
LEPTRQTVSKGQNVAVLGRLSASLRLQTEVAKEKELAPREAESRQVMQSILLFDFLIRVFAAANLPKNGTQQQTKTPYPPTVTRVTNFLGNP